VKLSAMEMLDVQDRTAIPLECEGGWASEQVWAIWRRHQSLVFVGATTADRPAYSPIAIPTELSQLPFCISLKFGCHICIPQFNQTSFLMYVIYVIRQTNYKVQILKTQDQSLSNACLYLSGTGSRGSSTATQNDTQVPIERLVIPHPIRQAPGTSLAAKAGYNINFPWVFVDHSGQTLG